MSATAKCKHKKLPQRCLNCNVEFHARHGDIARGNGKFCSHSCSNEYRYRDKLPTAAKPLQYKPELHVFDEQVTEEIADRLLATECLKMWLVDFRKEVWANKNQHKDPRSLPAYIMFFTDRVQYACDAAGVEFECVIAMVKRIVAERLSLASAPTIRHCQRNAGAVRADKRVQRQEETV